MLVGELEIEEVRVDIGGRVISDVGSFLSCRDPPCFEKCVAELVVREEKFNVNSLNLASSLSLVIVAPSRLARR